MPKRTPKRQPDDTKAGATPGAGSPARTKRIAVLVVGVGAGDGPATRAALRASGHECDHVATLVDARRAIERNEYDVVIVDTELTDGSGLALVRELLESDRTTRSIVTSRAGGVEHAVDAMRSGAADFIARPFAAQDLLVRVNDAARVAERLQRERRTAARRERAARRLETAKQKAAAQADASPRPSGAAESANTSTPQSTSLGIAAEFAAIVRCELDVESLLRRTLEFLLKQVGTTNAAVFLPTGHRDYSLGAYVNCDVPKDTAEVLLDHLADVLAPRLEHRLEIVRPAADTVLRDALAEHAGWLADSEVAAFSCAHDGECLAVMVIFRDGDRPFGASLEPTLDVIRRVFAAQMARVIRIHHRHRAEPDSPGFEVDGWNDAGGLAA